MHFGDKVIHASDLFGARFYDYVEAITYKNLLLRLQANLEKDGGKQKALLAEADKLRDELNRTRAAGGSIEDIQKLKKRLEEAEAQIEELRGVLRSLFGLDRPAVMGD